MRAMASTSVATYPTTICVGKSAARRSFRYELFFLIFQCVSHGQQGFSDKVTQKVKQISIRRRKGHFPARRFSLAWEAGFLAQSFGRRKRGRKRLTACLPGGILYPTD
jgi:hypothetical protein